MTEYNLSAPHTPSSFALKSKAKRTAQLTAVRKRRREIYKLFAEKRRLQQEEIELSIG